MSKFLCIFVVFAASVVMANEPLIEKNNFDLNLYLPSLQFRYEDGQDQTRLLKSGYSLSLAAEIKAIYIFGLEYNLQSEKTGNSSLSIARDFSEVNLVAGYNAYQIPFVEKNRISFFGVGYLGQNKNKITTQLLGVSSIDQSTSELCYGLGIIVQLKLKLFLIELGTRVLTSKSYEPKTVSVTDLRLGFQLEI